VTEVKPVRDAEGDHAPRLPLSRPRIARAALARIDVEGLDALSMRKLAGDLGVEAMSLYNHVRNKDDLLVAVSDLLHERILELYAPAPDAAWKDKARAMARAFWLLSREHPAAFSLVSDKPAEAMNGMRVLAACVALFTDAGFTLDNAVVAFQTAAGWLFGTVQQELGLMTALAAGQGFDDATLPAELGPLVDFKRVCTSGEPDERFARSLEIVLAGIEAELAPR
jgi:AcrR family transcriptional regulator